MLPWLQCVGVCNRMCYTLEELRQRPLPNEVDPTKMETYLTDNDFLVGLMAEAMANVLFNISLNLNSLLWLL